MQRRHQHVGDTFVALMLKMMLGHPERVVTQPIHQLRHRLRLVEDGGEMLVGIAPVIYRDAAIADIFDIDVPGEQTVEFGNHAMTSHGKNRRQIHGRLYAVVRGWQPATPHARYSAGATRPPIVGYQSRRYCLCAVTE